MRNSAAFFERLEFDVAQVGGEQISALKIDQRQVGAGEIGAAKVVIGHVGVAEICAGQFGFAKVGAFEVGPVEVDRMHDGGGGRRQRSRRCGGRT